MRPMGYPPAIGRSWISEGDSGRVSMNLKLASMLFATEDETSIHMRRDLHRSVVLLHEQNGYLEIAIMDSLVTS